MNNNFTAVLENILAAHGEGIFDNAQRTNGILLDLAAAMPKERLLARHFAEAGGFRALKNAGTEYLIVRSRIIGTLVREYSIDSAAAVWITNIFAALLGYEGTVGDAPPGVPGFGGGTPWSADGTPGIAGGPYHEPVPSPFSQALAIGKAHTVAVLADNTVTAHGHNDFLQLDVAGWHDIIAVAAGDAHTLGLTAQGQVLATGRNDSDQCDVGAFAEISAVYAFGNSGFGVTHAGNVLAAGKNAPDISGFSDIKTLAWHPEGLFGIREDGTVLLTPGEHIEKDELDWTKSLDGAVQIISTYVQGNIVLKEDGRVYKMHEPNSYFAHLRDIAAIVDISDGFAALRRDGTVRIMPYSRAQPRKPYESDNWHNIIAIFGKYKRLVALDKDAKLHAVCTDPDWLRRNGSLDFLDDWYPVMHTSPSLRQ